ncbi:MAG: hypothetical protein ACRYFS_00420 [Janthinobacterium lividum]
MKFTLFHLTEIVCGAGASMFGYCYGLRHYGIAGGVASALIGFAVGLFFGRVPGYFSEQWLFRDIRRKTSEQLKQMLRDDTTGLSPLLLAELKLREGKPDEDRCRN